MEEEKIAVATISNELYRTELKATKHNVIADKPKDVGGKNIGSRLGDSIVCTLLLIQQLPFARTLTGRILMSKKIEVTV